MSGRDVDAILRIAGTPIPIQAKWIGRGQPRDLHRYAELQAEASPPWIAVADRFSDATLKQLRAADANYVDLAGRARIVLGDSVLVVRDTPAPSVDSSTSPLRWSRSAITIVEAILAQEDNIIRTAELAERTGWTPQRVSQVLAMLDGEGFTQRRGPARGPKAERELVDRDELLESWSRALTRGERRTRMAHSSNKDVKLLLRELLLPALGEAWMATGWIAADLRAPFATAVPTLQLYVDEGRFDETVDHAMMSARLVDVEEGGRVVFWPVDPHALRLADDVQGIRVASPPRVYADLRRLGGRGIDAAEHLRDVVLAGER